MSNTQKLVWLRSLYLLSLIIIENIYTKISNFNTRLEFKVNELKFAKSKLRYEFE